MEFSLCSGSTIEIFGEKSRVEQALAALKKRVAWSNMKVVDKISITSKWQKTKVDELARKFKVEVNHMKTDKKMRVSKTYKPRISKKCKFEITPKNSGKKEYKHWAKGFGMACAKESNKRHVVALVGLREDIFSVKRGLQQEFKNLSYTFNDESESVDCELDQNYALESTYIKSKYYFF